MIRNVSLKQQLLIGILSFIILGMGVLFYSSYTSLKTNVDFSQETFYKYKINNIVYLIDEKYQKLQKTGMVEAYEEVFKKGTIDTVKEVFDKYDKDIYPFVIDENNLFILHPELDNKNISFYKDNKTYQNLIKMKNGKFDYVYNESDKWTIFKYYEPWDWIVGYAVDKETKYKELNKFRNDFILSAIFVLIAVSLIIVFIVRKVIEPVVSLSNASKEITSGNLGASILVGGARELKDLSTNFDIMRNKIVEDIKKLKENDDRIQGFNEELKKQVKDRTQDLQEEKEVFETLFNESSDGVCLLKDEKFIKYNVAFLEMINCTNEDEFSSFSLFDLSPKTQPDGEDSHIKAKKMIQECLKQGSNRFEWVYKKLTGEEFWVEVVLTKIVINHEELIHNVWRDIEDKKALELEIRNKNYDLQESNDELETMIENLRKTQNKLVESEKLASLGSLVAAVAHEINTPVGIGLTGSSHLEYICEDINEKYENSKMTEQDFEEYLKTSNELSKVINTNLKRTAEIIKNFKQVAVDQTSEQKRTFIVAEYIRGILVSIDPIIKKKDLKITIDCDDSLELLSYPGFYAQIVTNLVSNSIIHGFENKEKGEVSFIIKKSEGLLLFIYKDNGKGIPQNNLSKIFEPFFSTSREYGGSGLGLNIVYNLVTTNLKGTIDCESEVGKGTTFIMKIPV